MAKDVKWTIKPPEINSPPTIIGSPSYSGMGGSTTSVIFTYRPDGRCEPPEAPVKPSLKEFEYGCCATDAICAAFNVPHDVFETICGLIKIKCNNQGFSYNECRRIIGAFCKKTQYRYIPNTTKVTYCQMLSLVDRYRYLVMFDEHLSYIRGNTIFDSYFYEEKDYYKKTIPTGWWKIWKN